MSVVEIQPIVEGHAEQRGAIGVLLRRIAWEMTPPRDVKVCDPIRVPRSRLVAPGHRGGVGHYLDLAARVVGSGGRVLVLLDADDDCPALFGPALLRDAQNIRSDLHLSVVMATREFEAWFIASVESLRGYAGIDDAAEAPPEPEQIRGCKEWLSGHMSTRYQPMLHQSTMAARFDLALARDRSRSFQKFHRDVVRLLEATAAT